MSLDIKPMSPLKMKYINMLRERAKDLLSAYNYPDYIVSDVNLLRFVRGYMYNMDEAYESFSKMLKWRRDNNIDEYFKKVEEVGFDVHKIPYADVFEPIFHTNYHHKKDLEGHIIDIRLLGCIDVKALLSHPEKEWLDYNIYVLEWRIYTLNKYSEETGVLQRLCCIQDLKGVGMHMVSPSLISYLKDMTNITSHNYPETMHRSFVVNVPAIFSSLWSLAKPVMHPRTVKKVVICKGNYHKHLYEEIPIQALPTYLGGICQCEEGCLSCIKNDDVFKIPVSSKLTVPLHLKKGEKVEWDWKLESGTIDITMGFKGTEGVKPVYKGDRVSSHKDAFQAEEDGMLEFNFDNSFSWVTGKTVIGMMKISC